MPTFRAKDDLRGLRARNDPSCPGADIDDDESVTWPTPASNADGVDEDFSSPLMFVDRASRLASSDASTVVVSCPSICAATSRRADSLSAAAASAVSGSADARCHSDMVATAVYDNNQASLTQTDLKRTRKHSRETKPSKSEHRNATKPATRFPPKESAPVPTTNCLSTETKTDPKPSDNRGDNPLPSPIQINIVLSNRIQKTNRVDEPQARCSDIQPSDGPCDASPIVPTQTRERGARRTSRNGARWQMRFERNDRRAGGFCHLGCRAKRSPLSVPFLVYEKQGLERAVKVRCLFPFSFPFLVYEKQGLERAVKKSYFPPLFFYLV